LIALRREGSGDFQIQNAKSVQEWIDFINDSN
jgi:hypothetical protein